MFAFSENGTGVTRATFMEHVELGFGNRPFQKYILEPVSKANGVHHHIAYISHCEEEQEFYYFLSTSNTDDGNALANYTLHKSIGAQAIHYTVQYYLNQELFKQYLMGMIDQTAWSSMIENIEKIFNHYHDKIMIEA